MNVLNKGKERGKENTKILGIPDWISIHLDKRPFIIFFIILILKVEKKKN